MTKQQRKTIEREFFNYKRNRDKAAGYVASHAYDIFSVDYSEPRVSSSAGNVAEDRVVRLISEEDRAYQWCVVYQKTMERFYWSMKDVLMRRRYEKREHYLTTCNELHISDRTYYLWREDILNAAFLWAQKLKIF